MYNKFIINKKCVRSFQPWYQFISDIYAVLTINGRNKHKITVRIIEDVSQYVRLQEAEIRVMYTSSDIKN